MALRPMLYFAMLLLASPVSAQEVRGFVTEARSEQPLQGASVALLSASRQAAGTTTDGDGFFRFPSVQPGVYALRITFVGFRPWEEQIEVMSGVVTSRSVVLEEATGEIGEILVEADAASGITAVAAGLERIRPKDIARIPVPGATGDLAAYLGSVPGVVMPGDRGGRFNIRGGGDDQNLVLVDGIPMYGAFHLLSMFSAFSDEIIDRADFHTGGFGAEYGSRLSSVLDVRTRNGNKQAFGGSVAIAPFVSGIRVEGPIVRGRASFLVSGRRSLVEDLTPRFWGQRMPFRFGDGFAKVHALIGLGQEISAFGLVTDDTGQLAGSSFDFMGTQINEPVTDSLDLHWDNRVVGARYSLAPGSFRLEITGGASRFSSRFGPADAPDRTSSLESLDLRADLSFDRFDATWRLGTSVRETTIGYRLDDSFRDSALVSSAGLTEVAGWLEAEWFVGALTLTPGMRLYAPGRGAGLLAEPRARIAWRPGVFGRDDRFSASFAHVHQAATGLSDKRDVGNPFMIWTPVQASRPLPSATHFVIGWSGSIRGLDVAVETYRKRFEGLQIPVFSAFPTFTSDLQSARGLSRGLDVRAAGSDFPFVAGMTLDAALSWAWARSTWETSGGATFASPHDRRHSIGGLVTARHGELAITLQGQVGSGLPFTPSSGFDSWLLLTPDSDVAKDPGRLRVLYGEPNSALQPSYARFDLWLEQRVDRGRTVATIRAGAMNVLNRANLFYYDLFTYRRVNQLGFIPSVGIRLEVR